MQQWYNEAVASKTNDHSEQLMGDSTTGEESKQSSKNATSKDSAANQASSKNFGDDGYKYPSLEFPTS